VKKSLDTQNIIKNACLFSGSTYLAQTMFFIRGFLNARILGPGLYGLWSALNIILTYSAYANLGSLNAMNKEIPYHNGMNSISCAEKIKDVTFTICVIMASLFSFILIFVAIFLWNKLPRSEAIGFIAIALLSFINCIYAFYQTLLIAMKRFLLVSQANVIFSILSVILTIIFVLYFNIYGVYAVAVAIPLLTLLYLLLKQPNKVKLSFDFKETFRLINIGLPLVLRSFFESTVISVAGLIILIFLGKTNLGYHSIAMLAAWFLIYFRESIHRIFEPYIYQRYGETHSILELKKYLFKPTLIMSLLFPVILGFYWTAVTFFIRHFLPKYIPAIYPFSIILMSVFFISFAPTAIAFITAINKQKIFMPVYIIGIIIVAAISVIFINNGFGLMAVALGILVAFFFINAVIYIYALGKYKRTLYKCIVYLLKLCIPLLYITTAVIVNEVFVSNSQYVFLDALKLIIKLAILFIFSAPLIIIANNKTGIIKDVLCLMKGKK